MQTPLEQLFCYPQRFDFYQAVRLLESNISIEELTRFRAVPSLSFPVSPIKSVRLTSTGQYEFVVSFAGLYGCNGVLPNHYTELLIRRSQVKDFALKNFLDLFNHRMIVLFYQSWAKYRFYMQPNNFKHLLSCMIGNGTLGLQDRALISDETLIYYAGHFARQTRSAVVLQNIVADYFDVPVAIRQFQGRWVILRQEYRTRLGNIYSKLGINASLGYRSWNIQNNFRISIGPLVYQTFKQLLPNNGRFAQLIALTRHYIGLDYQFDVQLVLQAGEVPACRLSASSPRALGWDTWLKSRIVRQDARDTVLRAK